MVVPKSETLCLTVFGKNRSIRSQTLGISLLKRRDTRLPVMLFPSVFWRQSISFVLVLVSVSTLRRPKGQARVGGWRECRPLLKKGEQEIQPRHTRGREGWARLPKGVVSPFIPPFPSPSAEVPAPAYSGARQFSPCSVPEQERKPHTSCHLSPASFPSPACKMKVYTLTFPVFGPMSGLAVLLNSF